MNALSQLRRLGGQQSTCQIKHTFLYIILLLLRLLLSRKSIYLSLNI